jgi:cytochrome c biogenesis protein CcmG/thiol:disulfide interchange protein DsbE
MDKNKSIQLNTWVDERLAALNPGDEWKPNVVAALGRLTETRHAGSSIKRRWTWAAAAAVAACLCFMILPSPRVLAHRCLECSVAVWQALSTSGPVQAADVKPEDSRVTAPDFTLKDASGEDVKLSGLKGKVVVVNFWATWCEGCQLEIPLFIEFAKEYAAKGLVVIGISLDDDGWKSVRPWLKEKKVNYPIVIGNDELGKKYGLQGMPLTALVDRDGRIADVHSGLVEKAATEQKIRKLLQENGKKTIP